MLQPKDCVQVVLSRHLEDTLNPLVKQSVFVQRVRAEGGGQETRLEAAITCLYAPSSPGDHVEPIVITLNVLETMPHLVP